MSTYFSNKMIIAELGMTHDGSLGQAKAMISAAAECGVNAIKLQMHISHAETVENAPLPPYFKAEPRYQYFERTAFSKEQWIHLKNYAKSKSMIFIISPFSIEAAKLCCEIGVDVLKIPSGEVTNIPLLEYIASKNMPTILSSGMSSIPEIEKAIAILKKSNSELAIMQCTSEYPCVPEHVGLNIIQLYKELFPDLVVGLSDHTSGIWAAISAYTLGARIIEKHFTLSRHMFGPDAKMSTEPDEMKQLCQSISALDCCLNNPIDKNDLHYLENMRYIFQKSIVASKDLPVGFQITSDSITCKKPGGGMSPSNFNRLIGKTLTRGVKFDEQITEEDIE